ncbi:MAG: FG-GAP-like repeat-containing protein, partial [Gemmatimonadota bacterium]|nr:FG-GAP-like repeat-containing protein [Gemmatimonadota bacterium]
MRPVFAILVFLSVVVSSGSLEAQLAIKNRYWLEDSGTGETVWLFGHGITNLISRVQVDVVEHNRHYASFGGNCFRLHLTQGALGKGAPWKQLADGSYDLNRWNPLYWNRLRTFMDDALRRGIYPFIQIWDECVIEASPTRWRLHPFRPSNNVNNLENLSDDPQGHGMEGFYNVRNGRLMALQRKFVRRVLDETAHYGICIYSICNEYDYHNKAPLDWQQYWIDYFRDYERQHPRLGAPILVTNTGVDRYMEAGLDRFDVIDWFYLRGFRLKHFGRHGEDRKGTSADTLAALITRARERFPGKILINSRPTSSPDRGRKDFSNEEETRRMAWCFFMSASHLAGLRHLNPMDENDTRPWLHADPECVNCTDGLATERVLESVHKFIELASPALGEMAPQADFSGETSVLKLAGPKETILYLPEGGWTRIEDLDKYESVMRYDPVHPEAGLVRVDKGSLGDGILKAPSAEAVFFLQVSRPVREKFKFREVTRSAGILHEPNRSYHGAYIVDVDSDGLDDLFLTGHDGPNLLYINRTDETGELWFTGEASARGAAYGPHHRKIDGKTLWELHGAAFLDADHDGDPDLYLPITADFSRPDPGDRLLINDGNGYFTIAGKDWGITGERFYRRGATVGDFNRDGWDDIYVADNYYINIDGRKLTVPEPYRSVYVNNRGNRDKKFDFRETGITMTYTHGATATDVDSDGDLDLVE